MSRVASTDARGTPHSLALGPTATARGTPPLLGASALSQPQPRAPQIQNATFRTARADSNVGFRSARVVSRSDIINSYPGRSERLPASPVERDGLMA